jgi:hypothetical protein
MDLTADRDKCSVCGGRLRQAQDDDPVYIVEKDHIFTEAIEEILAQNGIPCLKKPLFGAGLAPRTGYAETYRIYVPFGALSKAKKLLDNFI